MKALLILAIGLPSLAGAAGAAGKADLIRLYEEEILAHDLYVELGKVHPGIMPFQNIPGSEARHREMVAAILKQEGIKIPKAAPGRRFVSKGLDALFSQWLEEGRQSPADACRVGVRLEEYDIADLRRAQTTFPDHKDTLASLEAASNNHLRAFHRNLTGRGGEYTPRALKAADFKAIIDSPQQAGACGGDCSKDGSCKQGCGRDGCGPPAGKGPGRGRGRGNGRGSRGPKR